MNLSHYPQTPIPLFENQLIELMSPFRATRFMNWQQINQKHGDTRPYAQEWGDLPTLANWQSQHVSDWGSFEGVPLTLIVRYANLARTRPWVCVPVGASDDLIERVTAFVIEGSHKKPIFEFANEMWNQAFLQSAYGEDLWIEKTHRIAEFCYGSATTVLATQFFSPDVAKRLLPHCKDVINALAVAPYIGRKQGAISESWEPYSLDELLQQNIDEIDSVIAPLIIEYKALCRELKIDLYAYEGGMHHAVPNKNDWLTRTTRQTFYEYNRSHHAGTATRYLWEMWNRGGGDVYCPYSIASVYKNGYTKKLSNSFFGHCEIIGGAIVPLPKYAMSVP